ncbi:hypothetical protein BJX76DRAFT_364817 [Aspergillus varians]
MRFLHFSLGLTKLTALTTLFLGSASSLPNTPKHDTVNNPIITRDVAIIGGGPSGTYAAVRLQQLGHSVILIEREDQLGGHTHTYYDSGTPIDYGVWVYSNTSEARSFFAHLDIPTIIESLSGDPNANQRIDFRTGERVPPPSGNVTEAMTRYVLLLLQHPYLADGFDLPDPVPEDLLLPFVEFIEKYDLAPAVEILTLYVQGFADILTYPTLYIMKYFSLLVVEGVQNGFLRPQSRANADIYRAAQDTLGTENVLLSSTIIHMHRPPANPNTSTSTSTNTNTTINTNPNTHIITLQTPTGIRTIHTNKTILATPPIPSLTPLDLNTHELTTFSKFRSSSYTTSILHIPNLPQGTQFINAGANTPYHITPLPGIYVLSPTSNPDLHLAFFGGGEFDRPEVEIQARISQNVLSLRGAGYGVEEPGFVAYRNHFPFGLHVGAGDIRGGFYRELYGLQGYRGTWYTGAAWHAHDSAALWRFTERVLREGGFYS